MLEFFHAGYTEAKNPNNRENVTPIIIFTIALDIDQYLSGIIMEFIWLD